MNVATEPSLFFPKMLFYSKVKDIEGKKLNPDSQQKDFFGGGQIKKIHF